MQKTDGIVGLELLDILKIGGPKRLLISHIHEPWGSNNDDRNHIQYKWTKINNSIQGVDNIDM